MGFGQMPSVNIKKISFCVYIPFIVLVSILSSLLFNSTNEILQKFFKNSIDARTFWIPPNYQVDIQRQRY